VKGPGRGRAAAAVMHEVEEAEIAKGVLNAIRIARCRLMFAARVPQSHGLDGGLRSRMRDPRIPARIGRPMRKKQIGPRAGRWC
jgi:hypothetical protein